MRAREIKFRAWDKYLEKMFIPQKFSENIVIQIGGVVGWFNGTSYDTKTNDFELMQFTGLKDKNGKEIYDGDVATSYYGNGKVYWDESTARFNFEFSTDTTGLWEMCSGKGQMSFEVIGNIYENSELLIQK